jgi:hypothetical protein
VRFSVVEILPALSNIIDNYFNATDKGLMYAFEDQSVE